ncbi:MAG: PTS IIA-like nitrogen-regulatory protein PtsN [Betaproteobacteria bacterium]|jgi:nitrogen PTS system EIIA component|nr:MAG: PTS IIA-like nitrogen-regulatory protein PtsN [Betaproteobacteria bacterium]
MNLIAQWLVPTNVVVADLSSKKRLLEVAGQRVEASHTVSATAVFESLFAREKLGSTALGHGIAIPHGRIKGLNEAVCVFIRLATPLDYDAPDGIPVDLVFVLLAPAAATDLHLQILAELAQMLSAKAMRERLRAAPDAAAIYTLIREWNP